MDDPGGYEAEEVVEAGDGVSGAPLDVVHVGPQTVVTSSLKVQGDQVQAVGVVAESVKVLAHTDGHKAAR